jgi:hypothetical protein
MNVHCCISKKRSGILITGQETHASRLRSITFESRNSSRQCTSSSCPRLEVFQELILHFSELLHQAIKIFDRHICYTGEKGRATVLKSTVLIELGEGDNASDCLKQARSLYQKLSKSTEVKADLVPADFDKFVHVWGR